MNWTVDEARDKHTHFCLPSLSALSFNNACIQTASAGRSESLDHIKTLLPFRNAILKIVMWPSVSVAMRTHLKIHR